jgi:hypothetical protein
MCMIGARGDDGMFTAAWQHLALCTCGGCAHTYPRSVVRRAVLAPANPRLICPCPNVISLQVWKLSNHSQSNPAAAWG